MQSSTTRQSPSSSPWGADHHPRQLGDIFNNAAMPSPFLFPRGSSDGVGSNGSAVSTNYFGIPVDNYSNPPGSNPGPHTKKNWDASSHSHPGLSSPRPQRISPNPAQKHILNLVGSSTKDSERDVSADRSSETPFTNQTDSLRDPSGFLGITSHHKGTFASQVNLMDIDNHASPMQISPMETSPQKGPLTQGTTFDFPKTYSPDTYQSNSNRNTRSEDKPTVTRGNISLTLPPGIAHTPSPNPIGGNHRRADTLPSALDQIPINFISAEKCEQLLESASDTTLLLDIRPYPQFSQANIMDSLNLCIPTTLLKRPSFNTDKLKDTFVSEHEKMKFSSWRQSAYIVVYDSNTEQARDATQLIHVLQKFKVEGWSGEAWILRGGFATFASRFPHRVRQQRQDKAKPSGMQSQQMSLSLPSAVPVAGGCSMPESASAEPFFCNIRQNMDLVGGVGQIPVKLPDTLTSAGSNDLPQWLLKASAHEDKGQNVSNKFLKIEQRELHRMREALDSQANYNDKSSAKFRVAGIEKGSKNRYNDIYPFDHSRVRLQDIPSGECDYINGNYLKAELTNKTYIATQAPVPDTYTDFWRVIWEQDVRVIVALTAEVERGQIKCHPYWNNDSYGPFKVKALGERRVYMDSAGTSSRQDLKTPQSSSMSEKKSSSEGLYTSGDERPFVVVRHFTLSHSTYPFKPIREITQLQYSYWPDFGTTSQPSHLLKLVEQCNKITRNSSGTNLGAEDVEPPGLRPIVVHCSAGCGRTGTFCTVDSVLDMLKQQRSKRGHSKPSTIHNDDNDDNNDGEKWIFDDSVDLIAKTVEDFRTQRPSMVQNLSQFVLCYEAILEWAVAH